MSINRQSGVALVVAMVALIILTVIGIATMGELLTQSSTVRNEQFRQRVFYAASSELNAIVDSVNSNANNAADPLIDSLLAGGQPSGYTLAPAAQTTPATVNLRSLAINARRNDLLGCTGESIGKVKVLAGTIDVTAQLG